MQNHPQPQPSASGSKDDGNDPYQIIMNVCNSSSNSKTDQSLKLSGGGLELIDDPTELLSKPLQSYNSASSNSTSTSNSNLNSNKSNRTALSIPSQLQRHPNSNSNSVPNAYPHSSSSIPSTSNFTADLIQGASTSKGSSSNHSVSNGGSKVRWAGDRWVTDREGEAAGIGAGEQQRRQSNSNQPQARNASTNAIPVIGGSGARVPTELLDRQGNFSREGYQAALNGSAGGNRASSSSTSASNFQTKNQNPNQQFQQRSQPQQRNSQSSSSNPIQSQQSIDLTEDDSEEEKEVDSDEPILVGSSSRRPPHPPPQPQPRRKFSDSEVKVDEARSNGPVCIGIINAMTLCLFGLPNVLTYVGNRESIPPDDPSFHRSNWPGVSHFWSSSGYRPVLLALSDVPPSRQATAHNGNVNREAGQIRVSPVLSPMANAQSMIANGQAQRGQPSPGPRILPSFGVLAEKFGWALDPLLRSGMIKCEARCTMAPVSAKNSINMHPLELLVFTTRPSVPYISEQLGRVGIRLEHPVHQYHPQDYPGFPEYANPHGSNATAAFRLFNVSQPQLYRPGVGGYTGTVIQSKPMTEEEKKRQVESVYFNLKSGTDLELKDQSELITTPLFDHQRQALTFLLERERERSFDEVDREAAKEFSTASIIKSDKAKGKQKAPPENLDADGIISLWKPIRLSNGKIKSYLNVVTQTEYNEQPVLCRGALLADDMGLGKTITVIALIAATQKECKEFERGKIEPPPPEEIEDDDDDEVQEIKRPEDFAAGLFGAPQSKKSKTSSGKVGGKRQAKRKDEERLRRKNLEVRSRATLIVAPLSVVSNWEEQFKEHWTSKHSPSILIYHGPSRPASVEFIANHDVVISTYSTIGTEFSNQQAWTQQDSDSESVEELEDPDIVMTDSFGNTIRSSQAPSAAKLKKAEAKKKRKRKFAAGKAHHNPLQRIEWFRVVLDEAHIIKEAGTWQSRAVSNLSAQRRTAVTGTPVQNRLDDLFSQLRFLRLDPFSDKATWTQYCGQRQVNATLRSKKNADDEPVDAMCLARVQTIFKFLTLRRTKDMKLPNGKPLLSLPPKTARIVHLEFDEHEKAKYRAMQSRYKEDFQDMVATDTVSANYATILHEIGNLRMSCDHSALVDASKDTKRGKTGGSGGGPSAAIRDDGITRDRAVDLFILLRDSEQAVCVKCNTDVSGIADGAGGMYGADNAEELDGALRDAIDEKKKFKGLKKSGAGSRTPKSTATTGMATPASPSEDPLKAVLTKCQHLFCSRCFTEGVGDPWPHPKSGDKALCPACGLNNPISMSLLLEVVELGPKDFSAVEEASAPISPVTETFDWGSQNDSKPSDINAMTGDLTDFGMDPLNMDMFNSQNTSPSVSLEGRTDLSSKIRALVEELIPFSQCNPKSKLHDPSAPILSHQVITEDEIKAEEGSGGESRSSSQATVQVVQSPPTFDENGVRIPVQPVKSIVFSQWTLMLDRIQKSLELTGIKFARLDGQMARASRAANLIKFKEDDSVEVFLVSLRAGGTGLNLVTACRAYLMDPYWNPAVEEQALDRIHRWGQKRGVITTKLIMKNTIEENMLKLQRKKMLLAQTVGGDRPKVLSAEEKKNERVEELRLLFGEDIGDIDNP